VKFDKEIWQGAGKLVDFDEPPLGTLRKTTAALNFTSTLQIGHSFVRLLRRRTGASEVEGT
jgi:hypothetical protein